MSGKRLPGFLRRTRRRDYQDSEEEDYFTTDDDDESQGKGKKNNNASQKTNGKQVKSSDATKNISGSKDDASESASSGGNGKKTTSLQDSDDPKDEETRDSFMSNGTATASRSSSSLVRSSSSNDSANFTAPPTKPAKRAASRSSTPVLSSSSAHFNRPLDRKLSYRESKFDVIIADENIKMSELCKLSWNGVPREFRGMAWKIMLGYLPTNASRRANTLKRKRMEYKDAIAQHYDIDDNARTLQEQETLRQVLVDVPRTAPEIALFRNERIKRILGRLLYIWAMRHPASSYVQGINDLATPLIAVFLSDYYEGDDVLDGNVMVLLSEESLDEVEADVYWCLTNILAKIQDHYTADQPGVQRMVMRLEELITRIDGNLAEHLMDVGIQFIQFSFKWMNCLLLREFNLKCVIRLWDTYISEDGFEDFHVYVCAAFLCQFSAQLQAMDFEKLFAFMQDVPTENWGETEVEMLLSQAYVLSTLFGGSDAHLTSSSAR
ncbi:unnamed protein product [Cylindrotheca closterium]|uniref:Rab-GAP TBC domain-containing protein n=1 Tax=Cylindrotheca closterium TaxID=2856 RepID=A0AAD2GE59_9STRA|nr:unnamed protein product [Cylindrotheca closterium]